MSEEEKKAYDNLIMLKYFTMEKEDKKSIEIILNLIDKQQKEIEELKEKSKKCEYYEMVADDLYKNSINKDKIREKTKELNNEMLNEKDSLEMFYRKKYCKEVLEKLLEEE